MQNAPGYKISVGRVLRYVPAYNVYQVVVRGYRLPVTATYLVGGSGLAGTRINAAIPAGVEVMVLVQETEIISAGICYILGPVCSAALESGLSLADQDVPRGQAGFVFDKVLSYPAAEDPTRVGLVHLGNQTSLDALPGELTISNPVGPALHVGYFMAQLRASDRAAVQAFRDGELVRVLAKQYELMTGAEETSHLSDAGEISVVRRVGMLPWESLGRFDQGPVAEENPDPQDDPSAPPTDPAVRPLEEQQRAVMRYQELTGYLGDIKHTFVGLPIDGAGPDTYGTGTDIYQGVFRESIGADGSYLVQSAKSLTFEKWSLIPFPLQKKMPGDPSGDTPSNYRPSGVLGEGDEQKREDFEFAGREDAAAHAMLGLDLHGFAFHGQGLQTLRAHKEDIDLQDEGETPLAAESGGTYPDYQLNAEKMWMPLPKYREVVVQSGRWEKTRYYASRSAIQQMDDGSVVIEDGYGSQLILSGGNLILTCPNDVIVAPGRSAITMAPQDAVIRAGNSADITASRRDVRIKAERNIEVIGANSGEGGILIESRDEVEQFDYTPGEQRDIRGLVLASKTGTLATLAKYTSLMGVDGGVFNVQADGVLRLAGRSTILAAQQEARVELGADVDLADGAEPTVTHRFTTTDVQMGLGGSVRVGVRASTVELAGQLGVFGALSTRGSITVDGSVTATGSYVGSSPDVGRLEDAQRTQIRTQLTNTRAQLETRLSTAQKAAQTAVEELAQTAGQVPYFGLVTSQSAVQAGLRTDEDYGTAGDTALLLPEWRWQQYARAAGASTYWEEPTVQAGDAQTMPWPGVGGWRDQSSHLRADTGFFEISSGLTPGQPGSGAKVETSQHPLVSSYLVNTRSTE